MTWATAAGSEGEFVTETKPPANKNALVLFALIIAGMAGTYLMYVRSGPSEATAAAVEAQAAKIRFPRSSTAAGQHAAMERMLANTQKVVQQFLTTRARRRSRSRI